MGTSIVTVGMNWAEFKCNLLPLWLLSASIPLLVRTLGQGAFTEHLLPHGLKKKNDVKLTLFSLINKMTNGIKGGQFSVIMKNESQTGLSGRIFRNQKSSFRGFLLLLTTFPFQ